MREQWPLEIHGIDTILEEGINVEDLDAKQILLAIFTILKKIETHLSILSETEITNQDVGD